MFIFSAIRLWAAANPRLALALVVVIGLLAGAAWIYHKGGKHTADKIELGERRTAARIQEEKDEIRNRASVDAYVERLLAGSF